MPPKKRTKYENDETVLETILNEVGNDWITQQWTNALNNGTTIDDPSLLTLFESFWIPLFKTRILLSDMVDLPDFKTLIFNQWLEMYESCSRCINSTNSTMNGYPVVSCRTSRNTSTKLQLHIVANYINLGVVPTLHTSHYCHQKLCLVHVCHENQNYNTHRNYCQCFVVIDNKLVWICTHRPRCLIPGSLAFKYLQ